MLNGKILSFTTEAAQLNITAKNCVINGEVEGSAIKKELESASSVIGLIKVGTPDGTVEDGEVFTINGGEYSVTANNSNSMLCLSLNYSVREANINNCSINIINTNTDDSLADSLTTRAIQANGKKSYFNNVEVYALSHSKTQGIAARYETHIINSTILTDAPHYSMGYPYAIGLVLESTSTTYCVNTKVVGTHSGVNCHGNLYINGGTYKGHLHGGFYIVSVEKNVYVNDALIISGEYEGSFDYSEFTNIYGAMYLGGANNIVAFTDNCIVRANEGRPFVLRGTDGEQNITLNVSNTVVSGDQQIRIDNETHKLNIGMDCNITADMIDHPEWAEFTEDFYRKNYEDKTLNGNDFDAIVDFIKNSPNDYVTPEMFGAIGDGIVDDTEAIQSAINSGKDVCFNSAYLITNTITISNPIDIFGSGKIIAGAIIPNVFIITSNEVTFSCEIDGDSKARTGINIQSNLNNVIIENCSLHDFKENEAPDKNTNAITVGAQCAQIFVRNVNIYNCTEFQDGVVGNGGAQGVLIFNNSNCRITNCHFDNIYGYEDGDVIQVFSIENGDTVTDSDVLIDNCVFTNIYKRAIKIQANGVQIKNNIFKSFLNEEDDGVMSCISLYGSNNFVSENIITIEKAFRAMELGNTLAPIGENYVINNTFIVDANGAYSTVQGSTLPCLFYIYSANNIIENNFIEGGAVVQMVMGSNATNTVLRNNTFKASVSTIRHLSGTIDYLVIENNTFIGDGENTPLYFTGEITNARIVNNIIRKVKFALYFDTSTPSVMIKNNSILDTKFQPIYLGESLDKTNMFIDALQLIRIISSETKPSNTIAYSEGDICFNSGPDDGESVGWVWTKLHGWRPFGSINTAGLPTVTSTDNGKFLRVADGAWVAVEVPSAEEATF